MDYQSGGQPLNNQSPNNSSSSRDKVFAAYNNSLESSKNSTDKNKSTTSTQNISAEQWKQYHTAWQNYYQKYYNDYYSKAANQYLATEKLKLAREKNDESQIIGSALTDIQLQEQKYNQVSQSLRTKLQNSAIERAKRTRHRKKLIPVFISASIGFFFLFLQYNRLIFAPIIAYVSPGNATADNIKELDPSIIQKPGPNPKLLIPKLNVNVPVAFNIDNSENSVMSAMNHGVAHFAIPGADALPGQIGNTIITGHSAGDIYSSNPYKFIFSGLERLQNKDLIYVNYNSVRYTYTITKKEVVLPTQIDKLSYPTNKPVLTLITCTPLGTAEKRLLVTAEQISASDGSAPKETQKSNTQANQSKDNKETSNQPQMPTNEPSFFEKIFKFFSRN